VSETSVPITKDLLTTTAAIEQKNMHSVQVAQMMLKAGNEKLQETSKTLDLIWANKKGIKKRLDEYENKDQPLIRKKKP